MSYIQRKTFRERNIILHNIFVYFQGCYINWSWKSIVPPTNHQSILLYCFYPSSFRPTTSGPFFSQRWTYWLGFYTSIPTDPPSFYRQHKQVSHSLNSTFIPSPIEASKPSCFFTCYKICTHISFSQLILNKNFKKIIASQASI